MIETMYEHYKEAYRDFDISMMKVDALTEAAQRQLAINYKEAELKVMTEGGTSDDYMYLCEAAANGFIERVVTALRKIKDAIVKFFSDLKIKVVSLFTRNGGIEKMEELEKKAKINPLFGKKKIVVQNINEINKCCDEATASLDKIDAKIKSGQSVYQDDIDRVEESFFKKYQKAIGVGSAVTMTVAAAIGTALVLMKKSGKSIGDIGTAFDNGINKTLQWVKGVSDSTRASLVTSSQSLRSKITKIKGSSPISWFGSTWKAVKEAARNGVGLITGKLKSPKGNPKDDSDMFRSMRDWNESAVESSCGIGCEGYDPEPNTDPWDDVMRVPEEPDIDYDDDLDVMPEPEDDVNDMFDNIINDAEACKTESYFDKSTSFNTSSFDSLMSELEYL